MSSAAHPAASTPQPVAPTSQPAAPAPLSRSQMLVLRWRELIAVTLTACLTWADGFHGWMSGLLEDIGRQEQAVYDKWIEDEYDSINSGPLSLQEANEARNNAKKRIDTLRAGTVLGKVIIPYPASSYPWSSILSGNTFPPLSQDKANGVRF
ncbi:hypothetical protein B9479_006093 [Cryptococcus floricola]|uniref:Uncharacterized protein n=1 Tax=Cryptococcus floricola TaxID=2591691 RepID=A0A5D3ASS5_9TREE|nr:hypothetical protein B9479_006093 [Cryptococcus floricola]